MMPLGRSAGLPGLLLGPEGRAWFALAISPSGVAPSRAGRPASPSSRLRIPEGFAGEPLNPIRRAFGLAADAPRPPKLDRAKLVRHPIRQSILIQICLRVVEVDRRRLDSPAVSELLLDAGNPAIEAHPFPPLRTISSSSLTRHSCSAALSPR